MRVSWFGIAVTAVAFVGLGCGPDADESDALTASPASGEARSKVTICHHRPGRYDVVRTISVAPPALRAHLRHGDTLGPCAPEDGGGDGGGGGGQCGGSGARCLLSVECCATLTCVDATNQVCLDGPCSCQVVIQ